MSETFFAVNDVLRRRLQTSLTVISLSGSVAATLFLLLIGDQINSEINAISQNTLTIGLGQIFSQFMMFLGILVFAVGAVVMSSVIYLMMAQRTRDFGLMKAAGCPNGLVFGYFLTELLLITAFGCLFGILVGFGVDYAVVSSGMFEMVKKAPNLWYAPLVFASFFIFALAFGIKPMLDCARKSASDNLSSIGYFGLKKGPSFKPLSRFALTLNIATRSLFRRQPAATRMVIFLSVAFILLTVSIAGSIIASNTTSSWIENAGFKGKFMVANKEVAVEYVELLSKFSGKGEINPNFSFLNPEFALDQSVYEILGDFSFPFEKGLICKQKIQEVSSYVTDPETLATLPVGSHRQAESLIIGLDSTGSSIDWSFIHGQYLSSEIASEAVIGDSVAHLIYSRDPKHGINLADPLVQAVKIQNKTLEIVGICADPINNGVVVYIPLKVLENLVGFGGPNALFVQIDSSKDADTLKGEFEFAVQKVNPDLMVVDLESTINQNVNFIDSLWSVAFYVPLLCLATATFGLVGFLLVAIEEQRHEFGVLRALGIRPRSIRTILGAQSLIVLFLSFGIGISLGTIITLMILMQHPLVTTLTIVQITLWLITALTSLFLVSLYPIYKFSKSGLVKMLS